MALRLSTGYRNASLARNSYPKNLVTAVTFGFGDGTGTDGRDRITDSDSGLVTAGFVAGDYITVAGAATPGNNVAGVKALAVAAGYIEVAAGTLSVEAAGAQVILGAGDQGGSFDELFRDCVIEVYSGQQPASADDGETGTKMLRITRSSGAFVGGSPTNGLNFGTATDGVLSKDTAEVWSGVGLATGTAGWFRCYANAYTTGISTAAVRFDGVCGVGSGELRLSSTSIAIGATTTADTGTVTKPAA